jgi:hypothetical protein
MKGGEPSIETRITCPFAATACCCVASGAGAITATAAPTSSRIRIALTHKQYAGITAPRALYVRVPDKPLPGDLVLRQRAERLPAFSTRVVDAWIVTIWPEKEIVTAGPYRSYVEALEQVARPVCDRPLLIWRDRARAGEPEQLELVGIGQSL